MNRRDFLKATTATCCGAVAMNSQLGKLFANTNEKVEFERLNAFSKLGPDDLKKFADIVIETGKKNNSVYSDIRVCRNRNQFISTREEKVQGISEGNDIGFGVRVLINGTWGFAASAFLNEAEVQRVTLQACTIAKANSLLQKIPVTLTEEESFKGKWSTPIKINPFDISIEDKLTRQFANNKLALSLGSSYADSWMWFVNEWKFFANSDGSEIEQDLYRLNSQTTITVIDKANGGYESRDTFTVPIGKGYEYISEFPWEADIEQAIEHTKMKMAAPSVKPEKRNIILHPTNLWLVIHESCGHPTELDRAMGYEANYAGTSFMTTDKLGKLKYGSDLVNLVADRTQTDGLATRGYDDDGVKTVEFPLIQNGTFVNYQTTREQASYVGQTKSHACAFGDSWKHFPIQRMPNVSLRPGESKMSLDELIASTDDAIYIKGDNSWSIDQQRYNFQFTGQEFWEIKNGKIVGMLNDVAYQGNTVSLWNSLDALCDSSEYMLAGSFNCGKGEPGQISPVSHGSVPARFRDVNILNTKQQT